MDKKTPVVVIAKERRDGEERRQGWKENILRWLLSIVVGLGVLVMLGSAVLLLTKEGKSFFFPLKLTYINLPFPTDKKVYKPGEVISYHVVRTLDGAESVNLLVTRTITALDGCKVSTVTPAFNNTAIRGRSEVYSQFNLPTSLTPGKYRIDGTSLPYDTGKPFLWYTSDFTVTLPDGTMPKDPPKCGSYEEEK